MNPTNLALRFALELAALAGIGVYAWSVTGGTWRFVSAGLAVTLAATLWGIFNVPGDPSRSGKAPVVIPGPVRLLLELFILFGGAFGFYLADRPVIALSLAGLIGVHYLLSLDRLRWLFRR